jgi:hypothetical protein
MKIYFKDSTDAVLFASDLALSLKPNSPWTMIMSADTSGGCSVTTATEELLEDTVVKEMLKSYSRHTIISSKNIQDG